MNSFAAITKSVSWIVLMVHFVVMKMYIIANSMGIHLVASCFGGAVNGKKPLPAQIGFLKIVYSIFQLEILEYYLQIVVPPLIVINLCNMRSDFYENNSSDAQCTRRGFQIKIILHPSSFNSSILTNSLPDQ